MTDTHKFRPHEGLPVTESGIEMPGAGGGFHKSLAVDALELEHRERVTLVVEVEVAKVRYDLVNPDADPDAEDAEGPDPYELRRVHVLKVLGAARVDDAEVRGHLDAQAKRVAEAEAAEKARKAAEKAAARGQLPLGSPDAAGIGELCAHDLPPAECTDCVPLPLDDIPEGDEAAAAEAGQAARNGLHAVTG